MVDRGIAGRTRSQNPSRSSSPTTVGYVREYVRAPPKPARTFGEFLGEMRTAGAQAYDLIEHAAEGAIGGAMLGKKIAGSRGGVVGGVLGGLAGGLWGTEATQHMATMGEIGNQYGQVVQLSRHHVEAAQQFLDAHGVTTNPVDFTKSGGADGAGDPTR